MQLPVQLERFARPSAWCRRARRTLRVEPGNAVVTTMDTESEHLNQKDRYAHAFKCDEERETAFSADLEFVRRVRWLHQFTQLLGQPLRGGLLEPARRFFGHELSRLLFIIAPSVAASFLQRAVRSLCWSFCCSGHDSNTPLEATLMIFINVQPSVICRAALARRGTQSAGLKHHPGLLPHAGKTRLKMHRGHRFHQQHRQQYAGCATSCRLLILPQGFQRRQVAAGGHGDTS